MGVVLRIAPRWDFGILRQEQSQSQIQGQRRGRLEDILNHHLFTLFNDHDHNDESEDPMYIPAGFVVALKK